MLTADSPLQVKTRLTGQLWLSVSGFEGETEDSTFARKSAHITQHLVPSSWKRELEKGSVL